MAGLKWFHLTPAFPSQGPLKVEHPYDVKVSFRRSLGDPVLSILNFEESLNSWRDCNSVSSSHLQALVFEKPDFAGECVEVCGDLQALCEVPDKDQSDTVEQKKKTLSIVGSVKIVGGL